MLISHQKKFIFTKTVKTGGTSAEFALQKYCLPPTILLQDGESGEYVTEFGVVGARGRNAQSHRWWNHMPAGEIREKIGEETWNTYFKFTVVRNPFDKVVSWYHFRHPEAKLLGTDALIDAFNNWILDADVSLPRDRNKYFIQGKFALDHVARYEGLADDLGAIARRLKFELATLPHLKSSQRGATPLHYRNYYGSEARSLVEVAFDYELSEFNYEF